MKTLLSRGLLLLVVISLSEAAKILIMPTNHNSHANLFTVAGELLKQAGHDVVVIAHPRHEHMMLKRKLNFFGYSSSVPSKVEEIARMMFEQSAENPIGMFKIVTDIVKNHFIATNLEVLENEELQNKVRNHKFDLAIVDGGIDRMIVLTAYRHNIPFITLTPICQPWILGVPGLSSIEPAQMLTYSDHMTFKERLINTVISLLVSNMFPPPWVDMDQYVTKYAPDRKPVRTLKEVYLTSEMWMINWDVTSIDFPRISAPHYQFLSALNAFPAKALPPDINALVDQAKHGVILVTFGSLFRDVPENIMDKLVEALGRRKEQVFFAYTGKERSDIPDNIYLGKWLPQNDLLAHKKTKLFITHAGNNGQLESLYHAVPMLCFPFGGDQVHNAARVLQKGIGLKLNIRDFSADELYNSIEAIVTNETIYANMKHISAIFHDLPSAREQLVFWVNHILKFGGKHLKPASIDLPFYAAYMLDIILLFFTVAMVISGLFMMLVYKCCIKRCFKGKAKKD